MGYPTCAVRRFDVFIGLSTHECILPLVPAPVPFPHLSFGIVSGLTQLFSNPSDTKHHDVLADGIHLMGRLSDAFPIVPHIPLGTGWNPMLPFTILFGSSTSCWGSGKVVLKTSSPIFGNSESDIASHLAFIISPHLSCNEPYSLPFDIAMGSDSTCLVGFSWGDLVACLVDIAIQLAMEFVMKCLGDSITALTRKFKARRILGGTVGKARAVVKESDKKLASIAKEIADAKVARQELEKLAMEGKISSNSAWKLYEESSSQLAELGAKEYAEKLATKTERETVNGLREAVSTRSAKVKELLEKQADAMQKNLTGELTDDAYKAERKSIDTELARERKAYGKAVDALADADDNSLSAIWQRLGTKEENKKVEVTMSRSKYMSWKDYTSIYGTPTAGVWKDVKTYLSLGIYPVYKAMQTATDEFFATAAYQSGHMYLYALALKGRTGLKKLITRSYKEYKGQYASEGKSVGYFSKIDGFTRLDLIDAVNGVSDSEPSYDSESNTNRFDWVGTGSASKSMMTDKLGWTTKAEASRDESHWADTTFVSGTTDRFTWVDDMESEESSST